jgi:hypothetical protein
MSTETSQGTLREAITRSSGGYVVIYAVGARAILVIVGDEGLDITRLHGESQGTLERIGALLADRTPQSTSPLPREAANAALRIGCMPLFRPSAARLPGTISERKHGQPGQLPSPAPRRLHR